MTEGTNDLPAGWATCRADAILSFQYGKALPASRRRPGAVGVYASSGRVGEHDVPLASRPAIVIGRKGAAGKVTIADERSWTIDTAYYVEPPEGISARFLAYQLEAAELGALDQSTAIPSLSRDDLNALTIRIAPVEEQERIVAAIDALVGGIESGLRFVREAALAVSALRRAVFEQSIAEGDEMALGDVLASVEAGKSFRCQSRPAGQEEWGVIKVSAMTWGAFNADENKAVLPGTRIDARWEIEPGDLLLSRANTTAYVGASVLVSDCRPRLLLSDKSLRLRPADGIVAEWLHAALSAPRTRGQISEMATGTKDSMRNISQAKLRRVRIRVPSEAVQREIVAELDRQIQAVEQASQEFARAREHGAILEKATLAQAMAGGLAAQDPTDEPAHELLRRIRADAARTDVQIEGAAP